MKTLLLWLLSIAAVASCAPVHPAAGQFGVGVTDLSSMAAPYKDGYFSGTVGTNNLLVTGTCTGCGGGTLLPPGTVTGQFARWTGAAWGRSTPSLPNAATATGSILRADGTNFALSTATYPDTVAGAGQLLRASAANVWGASTATYPDTVGSGNILYATAANVLGSVNGFNFNGTSLNVNPFGGLTPGPHAFGEALDAQYQFRIAGFYDNASGSIIGLEVNPTLAPTVAGAIVGADISPFFYTAASGTHNYVAGLTVAPSLDTLNGAAITRLYGADIIGGGNYTAASPVATAVLHIDSAFIGGAANYAVWSESTAKNRFDGPAEFNQHVTMSGTSPGSTACGTTPAVAGSDNAMLVTVGGGGAATDCIVVFATVWGTAPVCVANSNTDLVALKMVTTTSQLTVSATAPFTAASKLHILCTGY